MSIQILKYEEILDFSNIPKVIISEKDKKGLLFVFENNNFAGSLKGVFINEKLFNILEIKIENKTLIEEIYNGFSNYLFSEFLSNDIEILSWEKPENETFNTYLEKSGFKIFKKKILVEKDLENYLNPYDNPLNFKSLSEVGRSYFIEMMVKASTGDPFEDVSENPEEDFQDLVDYAGEKFNPDWWKIAYLENTPVGVVLPQIFANSTNEGSLFYVGIIPEFRGNGFGKIIHAFGLEFLSKKNVLKYRGSTDFENKSMIRIFQKNDCHQTGVQLFLKAFKNEK